MKMKLKWRPKSTRKSKSAKLMGKGLGRGIRRMKMAVKKVS